jgi:hypothetical protein
MIPRLKVLRFKAFGCKDLGSITYGLGFQDLRF